jgi:hypothetical protein
MDSEHDDISYARAQLEEARRRLDSVEKRITDERKQRITGVIDKRDDNLVVGGEEIEEIPEEHRQYVSLNQINKNVKNIEGHIQNIIIDCQMSVELAVKSMFKTVGQDFDYSHGIGFDSHNTQGFNSRVPADFPRNNDIVRAIFLTQLWEKFYELAKYGAPQLNVGPSVLFDIEDGERAINDASFCVVLAEDFIDYIEENGYDS